MMVHQDSHCNCGGDVGAAVLGAGVDGFTFTAALPFGTFRVQFGRLFTAQCGNFLQDFSSLQLAFVAIFACCVLFLQPTLAHVASSRVILSVSSRSPFVVAASVATSLNGTRIQCQLLYYGLLWERDPGIMRMVVVVPLMLDRPTKLKPVRASPCFPAVSSNDPASRLRLLEVDPDGQQYVVFLSAVPPQLSFQALLQSFLLPPVVVVDAEEDCRSP